MNCIIFRGHLEGYAIQHGTVLQHTKEQHIYKWCMKKTQHWSENNHRDEEVTHAWKSWRNGSSFQLTCPGGACIGRLRSLRPRHALITVLWRWRCISASSWFHSLSWAGPFISRPSNWICWTLHSDKERKTMKKQCTVGLTHCVATVYDHIATRARTLGIFVLPFVN